MRSQGDSSPAACSHCRLGWKPQDGQAQQAPLGGYSSSSCEASCGRRSLIRSQHLQPSGGLPMIHSQ